jgi:hypothetical protein
VEKAITLKMYFPDQEEYRSSGVQEFRSSEVQKNSELGTLLRRGATSQAYSWVSSPHGTWFQWLPFRRGLNPCLKDILNS